MRGAVLLHLQAFLISIKDTLTITAAPRAHQMRQRCLLRDFCSVKTAPIDIKWTGEWLYHKRREQSLQRWAKERRNTQQTINQRGCRRRFSPAKIVCDFISNFNGRPAFNSLWILGLVVCGEIDAASPCWQIDHLYRRHNCAKRQGVFESHRSGPDQHINQRPGERLAGLALAIKGIVSKVRVRRADRGNGTFSI